jgi:hypothetical protein
VSTHINSRTRYRTNTHQASAKLFISEMKNIFTMRCYSFDWARRVGGLDRAVSYTVASRLLQVVGSIGTVLLIFHFLSPVEQGYYYTLLSLAALQIVFELGFSFVILQMAAHESALLTIPMNGEITGDAAAHRRLASILRLTVRWYGVAAIMFAIVVVPSGIVFFSRNSNPGSHIHWLGPWVTTALAVAATLFITPLYSFIEGCQQVRQVAMLRMYQALVVFIFSWCAIASHHGLYASAIVNVGINATGAFFLYRRASLLISLWRHPVLKGSVSWLREVWPFQWKIAVSWFCSYFMLQFITPILFASRGPLEAGKMGFSLSIVAYLPAIALCWITPKAAPFGQLVKSGRFQELDARFFKAFTQSLVVTFVLDAICCFAVLAVHNFAPKIAARMESPKVFLVLIAAVTGSVAIQGMAIYLRSFKREPYLVQSVAVALFTLSGVLLVAPRWGSQAVAVVYFAANCFLGFPWAIAIFKFHRRSRVVLDCMVPSVQSIS